MIAELVALGCLAYLVYFFFFWSDATFPPGPKGWPGVGVVPQKDVFIDFNDWREKFGTGLLGYRTCFGRRVVVVADHEAAKELLVKRGQYIADRPQDTFGARDVGGNYGLLGENGECFVEQRRFALSTLRDFGFGKPIVEEAIQTELHALLSTLEERAAENKTEGVDVAFHLQATVSNVISKIALGRRFDYSDEEFFGIIEALVHRVSTVSPIHGWSFPLVYLKYIPAVRRHLEHVLALGDRIRAYLQSIIDSEKRHCDADPQPTPASYVDAFVRRQRSGEGAFFSNQQLLIAVQHLFEAGTETTATTVRWALLFLLRHPEMQERVAREIHSVVGTERLPCMADKPRLPYTEAVILEASRRATLVPTVGRRITEDFEALGYQFRRGDFVAFCIYALHMDPKRWPEPESFRPERFLNADGSAVDRDKAEMVTNFGAGKRKCLGESLARMELFLVFAALIQRLEWTLPEGAQPPGLDYDAGITFQPKPFKAIIRPRHPIL